ncbi:MAG TPA: glycoside hydrolase family 2 protein, partial [Ignavibacteria bacterium]|nr:glycoside hydrolase family 2 protein [Ignavibacteria bacterium]
QFLYVLAVSLSDKNGNTVESVSRKVGIRTIELIKSEKKENTFKLRINGRDIFAKGVNWIPADSFLPRVNNEKYKKLLTYAKDANMNIIRVWGGGIYESDYFYKLCDELGLLVWQDFMFACGSYPEHKEFINNVKEEVEQNVKRLQHHPSIALWCGNNENEWIWYQKYSPDYKEMPGYKIYHKVIPDILKEFDAQRPYHPSSPFGEDEDPNSFNSGNTHQWKIWSMWTDYTQVVNDKSLFVTEFGFQGPANKDTLEKVIPKQNRRLHDYIFEFHNKQFEGPERIWRFLSAHFPLPSSWDDYFYLAQLNQTFALKTCLEHWRTNGRTNGSIIWQINDSCPVTSWSIVDYDLKPKLVYYFVKNIFSPQLIYFSENNELIKVKLQNRSNDEFKGTYRLAVIDTSSGKIIDDRKSKIKTKAGKDDTIDEFKKSDFLNSNKIIITNLYNSSSELINTNYYHHKPWKYYQIAESNIVLTQLEKKSKTQLLVSTDKPAYFVDLYLEGVEFSKRGFTLLPNEEVVIDLLNHSNQINLNEIRTFSLNDFLR